MLCRITICCLAVSLWTSVLSAQGEVDGFHGYLWGTHRSQVTQIEGKASTRATDLDVYSADISLFGNSGTAFFFFDPRTDQLVQGMYRFTLSTTSCESGWVQFETALESAYPDMRVEKVKDRPSASESRVYDNICEFYGYQADDNVWRTRFINPNTGEIELAMLMQSEELKPAMMLIYRGQQAASIRSDQDEEDRQLLGPVATTEERETPSRDDAPLQPATFRLRIAGDVFEGASYFRFNKIGDYSFCLDTGEGSGVFRVTIDADSPIAVGEYEAGDDNPAGIFFLRNSLLLTDDSGSVTVTEASQNRIDLLVALHVSGMNINTVQQVETTAEGGISALYSSEYETSGECSQ